MVVVWVINSRPLDTIINGLPVITPGALVRAMSLPPVWSRNAGQRPRFCFSSPPLAIIPVVHLSADLVLLVTIPLLEFALELIATAIDHIEVVVRELPTPNRNWSKRGVEHSEP